MANTYQLSYCVNHYGYSSNYVSYFSNNNIINSGGGFAFYVGNASGIGSSFNNNIYTTGRFLGYWQGTSVATLAAWKSTSGHDTASISVDPYYYSKTTNDLHVFNPKLNAAAIYNPSVKIDIDKQTRNTSTPDIGADEFTPATADAGIVSLTNQNFLLQVIALLHSTLSSHHCFLHWVEDHREEQLCEANVKVYVNHCHPALLRSPQHSILCLQLLQVSAF